MSVAAFGAAAASTAKPTAPAAQADEQQLEEVIVTARRKSESLQDVPQTVTAVTANDVEKLNILRFEDISKVVAGLQFSGTGGNLAASVRGVTFQVASAAFSPTVAEYLNDAPVISAENAQSIFDIGQIEVLRGPQGTLRGIAAPSGAITVTTHRPDLTKLGGNLNVSASNLHARNFQGAVNFPVITDKLAIRLAVLSDENDGNGVRSVHSSIAPESKTNAQRVSVRFVPTDNITADVMYQRMRRRDLNFGSALFGAGSPGGTFPDGRGNTGIVTAGYNGPVLGPNDYRAVTDAPSDDQSNVDILTTELGWTFAGQKLSYVGSKQKYDTLQHNAQDVSNSIPNFEGLTFETVKDRITTSELRLASVDRIAGVLDYVVGVFNNYDNIVVKLPDFGVVAFNTGAFGSPFVPFGPGVPNDRYAIHLTIDLPRITNELSYFGNLTYHLGDKFEISGGARSIRSKVHVINQIQALSAFIALPPAALGFPPGVTCALAGFASTYPGFCDIPTGVQSGGSADKSLDTKTWLYDLSLAYHFNPDLMVYLHSGSSWREGPVEAGIANGASDPALNSLTFVGPEKSRSNEVGLKWSFLDHRGRLNLDYYHQTYTGLIYTSPFAINYQRATSAVPACTAAGNSCSASAYGFTSNADAKVDGFDVEAAFELTKHWSASGAFSWADGKLSNANIPCNDGNFDGIPDSIVPTTFNAAIGPRATDYPAGKYVAFCKSNAATSTAPKWNVNLQSEYGRSLTARANGFVRGLLNYQPSNPNTSQAYVVPAYSTLNLYVGLRGKDQTWEVSLFAKNATNTTKVLSKSATPVPSYASVFGPSGYNSISLSPRREIGISMNYRFD